MQLPPAFPGDSTTEARVVQRIADGELAHAQLQDGRELEIRELAVLGRRAHVLDQPVDLRPRQLRRPPAASLGRRIARLACPLDLAVRDALALGDFFVREALRAQPEDVCPRLLRQVSGHAGSDGEGSQQAVWEETGQQDSRIQDSGLDSGFRMPDSRGREAASERASWRAFAWIMLMGAAGRALLQLAARWRRCVGRTQVLLIRRGFWAGALRGD